MNAKAPQTARRAKKPMSNRKHLAIWVPVLALVTAVAVVANVAISVAGGWVESQLGSGTYTFTNSEESAGWDTEYYTSDYADIDEVDAAAKALVEEIANGGVVLAKNETGALPLATNSRVTMLGRAAADPVFGGAGSGSVDTRTAVTARVGLENAGFEINDQVFGAIAAYADENDRSNIVMDNPGDSTYYIGEMPVGDYEAQ
ncbi:MAG: beta-glucosidase, partial [Cellulomonadaceae bacterium]|nr:beta-glucosidase [Cellulomonadaceae bacterium]